MFAGAPHARDAPWPQSAVHVYIAPVSSKKFEDELLCLVSACLVYNYRWCTSVDASRSLASLFPIDP